MKGRATRELVRLVAGRLNLRRLNRHETGWACVDQVYEDLDRVVARSLPTPQNAAVRAVYAYEDGALQSFRAARRCGMTCLYDLPIAHWRTLRSVLAEEAERKPEWAATMTGLQDSARKLERKDQELALADRVIVASSFTRRSLEDHFGDALDIRVTPYGAPEPTVTAPHPRQPDEPLHVLYAGHLSQRKGIAYLFEAVRQVDFPWRLTLAGPRPAESCAALDTALRHPACRWLGSIPHAKLLQEMSGAHVFVFPSLIEGFGLVITEAMAAGLPVITTPHTAGPDLIAEGIDGHLVPIRDPNAIAAHLAELYDDEDRRYRMAEAALAKAASLPWSDYEAEIAALLKRAIAR